MNNDGNHVTDYWNQEKLLLTEDGATLTAVGELDLPVKAKFTDALRRLLAQNGPATVDLTGVDFMDSAGMERLIAANRALAPRAQRLTLRIRETGQVARIVKLCRLDLILDIKTVKTEPADTEPADTEPADTEHQKGSHERQDL